MVWDIKSGGPQNRRPRIKNPSERADEIITRYNMAIYECESRKKHKFRWLISLEDFRMLCKLDCFYCDGRLGKVKWGKGLDRIDSRKDYTMDNVYACCTTCNRIKGHDLTAQETKILVETLLTLRTRL